VRTISLDDLNGKPIDGRNRFSYLVDSACAEQSRKETELDVVTKQTGRLEVMGKIYAFVSREYDDLSIALVGSYIQRVTGLR
jgi:hypothetical protein